MTFDQLVRDPRFREKDIDGQLELVDRFYRLGAENAESPQRAEEISLEGKIIRDGFHQHHLIRNSEGADKSFHTSKYHALAGANDARKKGDLETMQKFLDQREEVGRKHAAFNREYVVNPKRLDRVEELLKDVPGGGDIKGAEDLAAAVLEAGLQFPPPQLQAAGKLVGIDTKLDKLKEGMEAFRNEVGETEFAALLRQYKEERRFDFPGMVKKSRFGHVLAKPRFSLERDDDIRSTLRSLKFPESEINFFMENELPERRKHIVEAISSLRSLDKGTGSKARKEMSDLEFARDLMEDVEAKGLISAAFFGLVGSNLQTRGGLASLVGLKEFGEKRTRQGAAMQLLGEATGHEFFSQLGAVLPDLAAALVPGAIAAKSLKARQALAKVPVLRGRGVTGGLASEAQAGLVGSAAGIGASAGIKTFGQAREQGFSYQDSLILGLQSFGTEAGVTLAFGTTGIQSIFARGSQARLGLTEVVRKALPEGMKEAAEETTAELLGHFTVQQKLNPGETWEGATEGAVRAGMLGGLLGSAITGINTSLENGLIGRAREAGLERAAQALIDKQIEEAANPPEEAPEASSQAAPPPLPQETPPGPTTSQEAQEVQEEAPVEPFTVTDFNENFEPIQVEAQPREIRSQLLGREQILKTLRDCLNG